MDLKALIDPGAPESDAQRNGGLCTASRAREAERGERATQAIDRYSCRCLCQARQHHREGHAVDACHEVVLTHGGAEQRSKVTKEDVLLQGRGLLDGRGTMP